MLVTWVGDGEVATGPMAKRRVALVIVWHIAGSDPASIKFSIFLKKIKTLDERRQGFGLPFNFTLWAGGKAFAVFLAFPRFSATQ